MTEDQEDLSGGLPGGSNVSASFKLMDDSTDVLAQHTEADLQRSAIRLGDDVQGKGCLSIPPKEPDSFFHYVLSSVRTPGRKFRREQSRTLGGSFPDM
jgi:hypothetical protein